MLRPLVPRGNKKSAALSVCFPDGGRVFLSISRKDPSFLGMTEFRLAFSANRIPIAVLLNEVNE